MISTVLLQNNGTTPYLSDAQLMTDFSAYSHYVLRVFWEYRDQIKNAQDMPANQRIEYKQQAEMTLECIDRGMHCTQMLGLHRPLINLFSRLQLSKYERFCLILLLSYETDVALKALSDQIFQSALNQQQLALLYTCLQVQTTLDFDCVATSVHYRLCVQQTADLALRPALGRYVTEQQFPDCVAVDHLPPLLIYQQKEQSLLPLLRRQAGNSVVLHLYGAKSAGKKQFTKQLAHDLQKSLLIEPFDHYRYLDDAQQKDRLICLQLFSILEQGVLYLGLPEGELNEKESAMLAALTQTLHNDCPLLILGSYSREGYDGRQFSTYLSVELHHLSVEEKIQTWQYYKQSHGADETINPTALGNQYVFNIGEIKNTYQSAGLLANGAIGQHEIVKAVKMRNYGLVGADLIETAFRFDDLIVEDDVRRQLDHVIHQLQYKNVLYHEWGFAQKIPYGRGISTLFYGPPGTGKTMAASVVANELGLDLYRIDLSKLISKYIGETEKNITTLFEKAKNMNVVLFFDEADALFAKRSEVKDSHDKNANAETAHLLQKLEEYEGVSILATNLFDQLDDAFRRRIKFMIPFKFPDRSTRQRLWQTMLPHPSLMAEELDVDFFASKFELSGSQIKEIVLNACYIAVSEQDKLANRHLIEAVTLNYQKYGKRLTKDDFGYLR